MTPVEGPVGSNVVESPADQPPEDEPEEPRPSKPKLRWGRRSHRKTSALPLRLHTHAETGESAPGDDAPNRIQSSPTEEKWRHRASVSTIAGTVAVLIYMIVVTPALLRPAEGGNPFFLILGAIVLFFLAEMLVNGLADLALWTARWLGAPPERARKASTEPTQASPAAPTPPASSVGAPTDDRAVGDAGR